MSIEYYLAIIAFILIIVILKLLRQREVLRQNMGHIFDILGITSLLAYREVISKPKKAEINVKEELSDDEVFNAINYLILGAGEVFQKAKMINHFSIRELISLTNLSAKTLRSWVLKNMEFGFIREIEVDGVRKYSLSHSKINECLPEYISYVEEFFGGKAEDTEEGIDDPLEFLRKVSMLVSNLGSLNEKEINDAPEYIKNISRELGILKDNSVDYERARKIPSLVRKSLKIILGESDEG